VKACAWRVVLVIPWQVMFSPWRAVLVIPHWSVKLTRRRKTLWSGVKVSHQACPMAWHAGTWCDIVQLLELKYELKKKHTQNLFEVWTPAHTLCVVLYLYHIHLNGKTFCRVHSAQILYIRISYDNLVSDVILFLAVLMHWSLYRRPDVFCAVEIDFLVTVWTNYVG